MVSFIIIGRNEGWRLKKCFSGIYNFIKTEGITDYEVIYVDSKSTDDSISLSKSFSNTKTILIKGECNAAVARNIGAIEARGDILFFIDGDMELIPGFWNSIVKNGKLVYPFVSGIEKDILHDNEWNYVETQVRRRYVEGKDSYEINTGGLFVIEAKLWKEIGGMDNRFKKRQDADLGFRMAKIGCRLCRKPQIWVNHFTRYYEVRSEHTTIYKYTALLMRKHIFNYPVQRFLFNSHYSVWILLISVLLMIFFRSLWPALLYLAIVLFRVIRVCQKNKYAMNVAEVFFRQIRNDCIVIYNFIFFYPKRIEQMYDIM